MTSSAPKALDLFCCAGGATRGLQQAGFHVTGVDIKPQPNYVGDVFIEMDALQYLKDGLEGADFNEFDLIWASPPCQRFTSMTRAPNAKGKAHPDLITPTRELLKQTGRPWIIENVPGAPLLQPTVLCGTMFGLQTPDGFELRRHRIFETSFPVMTPQCQHHAGRVIGVYGGHFRDRRRSTGTNHRPLSNRPRTDGFHAMGIDWTMTVGEISEAIPPSFSRFIAEAWLRQHGERAA